jgi:thiamine biosynthesis lipoprotein
MKAPLVRRAQPWLGTIVSIDVVAEGDAQRITGAFAGAFAAIERVHVSMSRQREGSDVARFNAAQRGEVVVCDAWTIQVLRLAQQLRGASGGLFDVSLGRASQAGYRVVDTHQVIKLLDECCIDLGGIAKGYAVDRAVMVLRACGVRRGLVNAGGDLRAFGPGAWPIAIRGGLQGIALQCGAVATSQYRRGRSPFRDDALIAPDTGAVHAIDRTITVAAPRCVFADALTKVVALSGAVHHPLLRELGGQAWLQ